MRAASTGGSSTAGVDDGSGAGSATRATGPLARPELTGTPVTRDISRPTCLSLVAVKEMVGTATTTGLREDRLSLARWVAGNSYLTHSA